MKPPNPHLRLGRITINIELLKTSLHPKFLHSVVPQNDEVSCWDVEDVTNYERDIPAYINDAHVYEDLLPPAGAFPTW